MLRGRAAVLEVAPGQKSQKPPSDAGLLQSSSVR